MTEQWSRSAGRRRAAFATAALTGAALLAATLMTAAPAQASSYDCASWKAPGRGPAAARGTYCFGVNGSGHKVDSTYGNYSFLGISLHPALYHEREVVRFYDKRNANYATLREPARRGWTYGNQNWTTNIHGTVRSGRVCGSLRGDGTVLATVCEAIP